MFSAVRDFKPDDFLPFELVVLAYKVLAWLKFVLPVLCLESKGRKFSASCGTLPPLAFSANNHNIKFSIKNKIVSQIIFLNNTLICIKLAIMFSQIL